MRSATLSGFGQGAGPVLSVKFEPPEFDPPQAVASRVSASTMDEERRRILAILGVHDTPRGHFAEESHRLSGEAKIRSCRSTACGMLAYRVCSVPGWTSLR